MRIMEAFRILFRRGVRVTAYSHHCERELTPDEVQQIDDWMEGVDKAFEGIHQELAKMPKFAHKCKR